MSIPDRVQTGRGQKVLRASVVLLHRNMEIVHTLSSAPGWTWSAPRHPHSNAQARGFEVFIKLAGACVNLA